jgi:hypothetical protein
MVCAGFAHSGRCARELSLFRDPPGDPDLFVSKKPLDILRLERVFLRDAQLFVLYIVRDPRAVITSRHAGRDGAQLSDFAAWAACERAAARLVEHPRFLRVRYERLVEDPDAVQAEIARRFPLLRITHRFADFHERARPTQGGVAALGGLRAPEPARIAAWQSDLPRVKAELLRHPEMARALIDVGYERGDGWLTLLERIAPHPGPGRSTQVRTWLHGLERRVRYAIKSQLYLARKGLR